MLRLSGHIPGILFPANTFSSPVLYVSNHNPKRCSFKSSHFAEARAAFDRDLATRWNHDYLDKDPLWVDTSQEIYSKQLGTTLLHMSGRNAAWTDHLTGPVSGSRSRVTHCPWALTDAGSVTAHFERHNSLYMAGIIDTKAYSKTKEQLATPFQEELFELPLLLTQRLTS